MPTEKQIAANRANSKKSTGPRTPEGKAKTRLNAKRDGITGQVITLSEEDLPVFEQLKAELIADLAPKTTMELRLASAIAWDTWRLDHLRAVEVNLYAAGIPDSEAVIDCDSPELHTAMADAFTFTRQSAQFARMSLYEQRLNRSIHKNLAALEAMQARRKHNYEREVRQEALIARANDFNGIGYQPPAEPSASGFVFSNREVLRKANRLSALESARHTLRTSPYKVQFAGASAQSAGPAPEPSSQASRSAKPVVFPQKSGPGMARTSRPADPEDRSSAPESGTNPTFLSR